MLLASIVSAAHSRQEEHDERRAAAPDAGVISELALARAQRNTVLIIDDLFSSRLLLAEIVRQIDGKLNLELFDTPSRALEFARNNRVDMVLTDYKLPEFDGIELVKQTARAAALRRRADRRHHRRRRPPRSATTRSRPAPPTS